MLVQSDLVPSERLGLPPHTAHMRLKQAWSALLRELAQNTTYNSDGTEEVQALPGSV